MLDRPRTAQARNADAADPARRHHPEPQSTLASLQAKAGNKAVTAAIQRASNDRRRQSWAGDTTPTASPQTHTPANGRTRSNSAPPHLSQGPLAQPNQQQQDEQPQVAAVEEEQLVIKAEVLRLPPGRQNTLAVFRGPGWRFEGCTEGRRATVHGQAKADTAWIASDNAPQRAGRYCPTRRFRSSTGCCTPTHTATAVG